MVLFSIHSFIHSSVDTRLPSDNYLRSNDRKQRWGFGQARIEFIPGSKNVERKPGWCQAGILIGYRDLGKMETGAEIQLEQKVEGEGDWKSWRERGEMQRRGLENTFTDGVFVGDGANKRFLAERNLVQRDVPNKKRSQIVSRILVPWDAFLPIVPAKPKFEIRMTLTKQVPVGVISRELGNIPLARCQSGP